MIFNTTKRIIFLAALLLISKNVSAQTFFNNARADYDSYYENKFGFEVNANISNTTNALNFTTSNQVSFSTGLVFSLPYKYPVTIVPMVLYSQKGFVGNTPYGRFTQRSDFIDIPLLAKITITGPLVVYVGPQASLLITTANTYDEGFAPESQVYYEYTGSKITYQGVAGIGFNLDNTVNIHARYAIDIAKKYGNANQYYVPGYRRTVIQFGVGFNL